MVGSLSAITAAAFIALAIASNEQKAQERAIRKLQDLMEAAGPSAGQACFAGDETLGQEIAQAIIRSGDVSRAEIRCNDVQLAVVERPSIGTTAAVPVVRALFSPFYAYEQIGEMAVTPDGQAIDSAVARDVGDLGFILVLFGAGVLIACGLAANTFILRPVKAILKQLRSCDPAADVGVAVPPPHANNVLGRLVGEVNELLRRLRGTLQHECERHLQKTLDERLRLTATVAEQGRKGVDADGPEDLPLADAEASTRVSATAAILHTEAPAVPLVGSPTAEDAAELAAGLAQRGYQVGTCARDAELLWRLDMTSWRLTGPAHGVAPLTHAETAFLATLAKSPGQPVSRGELITAMGHRNEYYDRRRLDTFVSRLRKKVGTGCGAELPLRSIHAYGYALAVPIQLT